MIGTQGAVHGTAARTAATRRARGANRMLAGFAVVALLFVLAASRVHINASGSDDAWGYLALPLAGDPEIGQAVLFDPPAALHSPMPYMKTVRGLPGAEVSVDSDGTVRIDGVPVGRAKPHALDGRPLAPIAAGTIPAGHYYLHADHVDSHDSRYAEIGFVPRERIFGRALALPDLPWLGLDGPLAGACGRRTKPAPSCPTEPAP